MKATFYGHACVGLQLSGADLLFDPFISPNKMAAHIDVEQLDPRYILLSHGHEDHLADLFNIQKNSKATVICNADIGYWLNKRGIKEVHGMNIGGAYNFDFGRVKMVTALHSSSLPDGSYGGNPAGILITTLDEQKIYFAGDTGLFGDMKLIGDEGIDLAIIPIGDNYTMGPDDARRALILLRPKYVIPIHYNTWPLIAQDVKDWESKVKSETNCIVQIIEPGYSFELESEEN